MTPIEQFPVFTSFGSGSDDIPVTLSRESAHPVYYIYYKYQTGSPGKKITAPRSRGGFENAYGGMKGDPIGVLLRYRDDRAAIWGSWKKMEKTFFPEFFRPGKCASR